MNNQNQNQNQDWGQQQYQYQAYQHQYQVYQQYVLNEKKKRKKQNIVFGIVLSCMFIFFVVIAILPNNSSINTSNNKHLEVHSVMDGEFHTRFIQIANSRKKGFLSGSDAAQMVWDAAHKYNIDPYSFAKAVEIYRSSDGTVDTSIEMLTIIASKELPCKGDIEDWSSYLKFIYDETLFDTSKFKNVLDSHIKLCSSPDFVLTAKYLGYLNNGMNTVHLDYLSRDDSKLQPLLILNQFQWNLNNSNSNETQNYKKRADYNYNTVSAFLYEVRLADNAPKLKSSLASIRDKNGMYSSYQDLLIHLLVATDGGVAQKVKSLGFKKPGSITYLSSFLPEYQKGLVKFKGLDNFKRSAAEYATRITNIP